MIYWHILTIRGQAGSFCKRTLLTNGLHNAAILRVANSYQAQNIVLGDFGVSKQLTESQQKAMTSAAWRERGVAAQICHKRYEMHQLSLKVFIYILSTMARNSLQRVCTCLRIPLLLRISIHIPCRGLFGNICSPVKMASL